MLIVSKSAKISPLADIEDSVRGTKIVIEDDVFIDSFVKIKSAGGMGNVTIGEGTQINSGTVIYSGNGVQIGKAVLIAANSTLAPVNHAHEERGRKIVEQRFAPSKGGIVIEDDVWIGVGVIILDGARIREGCVIGAGSVVRSETQAYGVYAGNPLVKIRDRR